MLIEKITPADQQYKITITEKELIVLRILIGGTNVNNAWNGAACYYAGGKIYLDEFLKVAEDVFENFNKVVW